MKKLAFFGILLYVMLSTPACYYDKEQELYPSMACDTASVSFSNDILPMMNTSCNSCHSTSSALGGIVLDNYGSVSTQANNGKLYSSVAQINGASPMPKGGTKLDACKINKIRIWVAVGAPNN